MKSNKVKELVKWLNSRTRNIDLPRDYSEDELISLIEISESELSNPDISEELVEKFKSTYTNQ